MQAKQYIGESWKHGILILGAILVLLPFYMMVSMSLKSQQEIQSISGGLIGAQEVQTFPVCVKTGYSEETCTSRYLNHLGSATLLLLTALSRGGLGSK